MQSNLPLPMPEVVFRTWVMKIGLMKTSGDSRFIYIVHISWPCSHSSSFSLEAPRAQERGVFQEFGSALDYWQEKYHFES